MGHFFLSTFSAFAVVFKFLTCLKKVLVHKINKNESLKFSPDGKFYSNLLQLLTKICFYGRYGLISDHTKNRALF